MISRLYKTLKYIYSHPLNSDAKFSSVVRFFKWQINILINSYPIIYQFTENSKLIISKGMTGATGNLYCGLMEYNDMGFLLHFLRSDDLFIDVGANVGVYTLLASAEIGSETIAIEPVPITFNSLKRNIYLNEIHNKVECLNIGIGSKNGNIKFTKSLDTVNHVATSDEIDVIDVEIKDLDSVIGPRSPILLKIDVEGYETEVINGAKKLLKNQDLNAIIIELNGSGARYGFDENKIHQRLIEQGFNPFSYDPLTRQLSKRNTYGEMNTIYLRDTDFVTKRVNSARKIKIGRRLIKL